MNKFPFGIKNKEIVPLSVKKDGAIETFGNKGFYGNYFDQLIYESVTDYVWGTQAQTLTNDASFYTDASGNPLDSGDVAVVISDDAKILINHNVTQTANLLFNAGGSKITIEMMEGVTLAMGAYDLTIGGSGDSVGGSIRLTQTGALTINGNRGLSVNNSVGVYEDFKTKNLIINVQSNTTIDVDADNIIFVDEFGGGVRVNGINDTFDMATDRIEGIGTTNVLVATLYQIWRDSAGVKKLAPDLVSTTDGTTASKLVDSAADFVTYLVQVGDIVYNTTDLTQTTVTAIDTLTTLSLADDIFVSGKNYKIRMLSPPGLGSFSARIGATYNNSAGNLDDSTYTQIQEEKYYSEAAGDFTVTGLNWSTGHANVYIRQVNDWTGKGSWKLNLNIRGAISVATTSLTLTMSGVSFDGNTAISGWSVGISVTPYTVLTQVTGVIFMNTISNFTAPHYSGDVPLTAKPTFHS